MNETFTLNNGAKIPFLGLGTWLMNEDVAYKAVLEALHLGYRHIDTAEAYANEKAVGKAIQDSGIPRKDIFLTTKLAAECKDYESAKAAIEKSLEDLGLDYIDLMIIHSPEPWADFRGENHYFKGNKEAWRALEDAQLAGKIKSIGVSNFLIEDLESLLPSCRIKPAVNQILMHIRNVDGELLRFCKDNDILVEAYSPIAHGEILKSEEVMNMAKRYGVSVASLCIRFIYQLGAVALPKASSKEHLEANLHYDFVISEEDMETLLKLPHIDNYGDSSFFPVYSGKGLGK